MAQVKPKTIQSGLSWKRRVCTLGHSADFLYQIKLFLNETAFYSKLTGWFSGPVSKFTYLSIIASKFGPNKASY